MGKVKYWLACCLLVFTGSLLQAQDDDRVPNIEKLHLRKLQFLADEAQLTPQEMARVKPVFLAYEKALWNLHQQNRSSFRTSMKDRKKEPNYAELNDRYVDSEFKQAQLLKNYHSQLRKVLDPKTLFDYYRAERQFKRKLLENFHERRPMEQPRPQ